MSHVERFDAETEADIAAGWVDPKRADEYRAKRLRLLARALAELSDESARFRQAVRAALLRLLP